jgi:hypothetical protein
MIPLDGLDEEPEMSFETRPEEFDALGPGRFAANARLGTGST